MEILLIISLVFWLLKKPSNVLYCGIFAWTGDSNRKFNWDKFNILGILNNERGGDSCGRVSGDISQYGIYKTSDYFDFIEKNEPFPIKERMIIGHDRKASFGYAITENNAQPVVLKENDEIVFVLAHNGTIHNIDNIAKKYDIEKAGKTDSWVLANIIYTYGFDVLKEYEGAASLVIYDRKKYLESGDTYINIFKGKSKPTEYAKYESEERPLYILDKGNNSLYVSSLDGALRAIGGSKDTIFDVECNKVFTIKNGIVLPTIIDIDRLHMTQVKTYPKTTNYPSYPEKRYGGWGDSYGGYNGYDSYDDNYDYRNNYHERKTESKVNLDQESFPYTKNKIDFKRGMFCINEEFANGIVHLDKDGYKVSKESEYGVPFYFINGVMLADHDDFNKASRAIKTVNATAPEDLYPILLRFSVYPVYFDTGSPKGKCFYKMDKEGSRHIYDGELQPVFSSFKYQIKNGLAISTEYVSINQRTYPSKLFKKRDLAEPENYSALNENIELEENFEKEKFKVMEDQVMEQETAHILADLLESFGKAKTNLKALGDDATIKILLENLDTIEDELFLQEDGSLYKKTLKLTTIWEKAPF